MTHPTTALAERLHCCIPAIDSPGSAAVIDAVRSGARPCVLILEQDIAAASLAYASDCRVMKKAQ